MLEIATGHGEGQREPEHKLKEQSWSERVLPQEFNEIAVLNKFLSGVKARKGNSCVFGKGELDRLTE